MHIKTMKWVSIASLLLAMVFWPASSSYQTELFLVVTVAAAVVVVQAYRTKNYPWAAGFLAIGLLFNPVIPVFQLAGMLGLALVVFAIAPFAVSLAALRSTPLLSIPSITDRTPGSQSL
jgi:uncharacterized protein DUF6804